MDGVDQKILSLNKGKKRKLKDRKKQNNPGNPGLCTLTTDHFDLTIKRLEEVYLDHIKEDVESVEKSMSKIKMCVEIVSVAIASAVIVYIANTILSFLGIT